jgi:hypothetical protein
MRIPYVVVRTVIYIFSHCLTGTCPIPKFLCTRSQIFALYIELLCL